MRNALTNLAVFLISSVLTLLALELIARTVKSEWAWEDYRENSGTLFRSAYPAVYDPDLGWVLEPNVSGRRNAWGTQVTIDADGIRSNGPTPKPGGTETILAIGDSFTFGDQASDQETWPAYLQARLDRRVINGGVFGYGFDQSVIRAKKLIQRYQPDTVLLSFIADDVDRTELQSRMGVAKPYFALEGGRLIARNNPVPRPGKKGEPDWFQKNFGYSFFVHVVMKNFAKAYWLQGEWKSVYAEPRRQGSDIACALLSSLKQDLGNSRTRLLVMAQYSEAVHDSEFAINARIAECATDADIPFLDLGPALRKLQSDQPDTFKSFFHGHMTAAGNHWVAEQAAAFLTQLAKGKPS